MHEQSVETLEFPKVLAQLADETGFSVGRELALALTPSPDPAEAGRWLAFTSEAVRLLDERPGTGIGPARDIRPELLRTTRGGDLNAIELVAVVATLRSARHVARVLADVAGSEHYPQMAELAERLPVHADLIARLESIVDDEGRVLDLASLKLRRLRSERQSADARLQQRVRTLVTEFGDALQEPIVTMRGDRYVVPVKADFRGRVRGIVHDQSASGATLYVEPMAVVELNNHLREIQAQEAEEIRRILREVSAEIGAEAESIGWAVDALAEFDLQLAKARHARAHRCHAPRLNAENRILLEAARHPLLTGDVVPTDFRLGEDFRMVVITGPNTGGKTVALKTVGLLTLMAQCGMHVPAEDGSEIAVMEDVCADIGDEQSIEQSLSTFSSHMTRIIEILRRIEVVRRRTPGEGAPRVLVLFDELGAGTDPDEGSALARSILTYLLDRKVAVIATTHYSELKAFAHEQRGVVNASVAFDVETLSPTYHLEIGVPGRSNALAIAERLGLDTRIVRGARRHLGAAGVQMEGLLEGLQQERAGAAQEREQLSQERELARRRRDELDEERERLEQERTRILEEARAQARAEIEGVMAELNRIRRSARSERGGRNTASDLRRRARRVEQDLAPMSYPRARGRRGGDSGRPDGGPPQVGDAVRVLRLDQTGRLLSLSADGREAEVGIGPMRMRVPLTGLERLPQGEPVPGDPEPAAAVSLPRRDRSSVSPQLDVRGERAEDAIERVDGYLNDAALSGLGWVRIVHGKGTGALRTAVRRHLAGHPLVRTTETPPPDEGGDGVTLVQLAG